jgi:hypothetical protein
MIHVSPLAKGLFHCQILAQILLLVVPSFLLFLARTADGAIFPHIASAQRCTNNPTPVIGCIKNDPPFVVVTYPAGNFKCGSALTLEQASQEPKISVIVEQPTDFYTILLVDTTDSFLHPILHYGATNVRGSDLLQLTLSDAEPFSVYRGPSPPTYIPGIESQHFIYEWIVSKQNSFVDEPPLVESTTQFDYQKYLKDVNATLVASTYFSSGFCVDELIQVSYDAYPSVVEDGEGTETYTDERIHFDIKITTSAASSPPVLAACYLFSCVLVYLAWCSF